MSNILITAPSLDEKVNISGISSLTRTIISTNSNSHRYLHFRIGKKDAETKGVKWFINQIALLPRFIRFARRNKVDVIHLNTDLTPFSLIRDFPILLSAKFLIKKKVLLHLHGGYFLMKPPSRRSPFFYLIRSMLRHSTIRVVLSEIESNEIKKHYGVECEIMPNAVRTPEQRIEKDFSGRISLFFMGRIVRAKGIFLLAQCLKELEPWADQFDFHLYGTGPDYQELHNELCKLRHIRYIYHGVVNGREKEEALRKGHIFLLPSLYGEGLPVALLESMSRGCVPVVSNDASIGTVVRDGINGYIFPKGSTGALKEKLIQVFKERDILGSVSTSARNTIHNSYNLESYVVELNRLYKNINHYGSDQFPGHRVEPYHVRGVI